MPWLQVKVDADPDSAAAVEEALGSAGAVSITYEDAGASPILEPEPGSMPLWQALRLIALFPDDVEPAHVTAALADTAAGTAEPEFERLPDRDWERAWLDDWQPIRCGRRLWIAPSGWPIEQPDAVVVRLDPGLAFGTGTHESTALCLEWLEQAAVTDATVLDYGCGSGILAVAALLLGAAGATAIDIDPQALDATRANAAANGVEHRLAVREAEAGAAPAGGGPFDIVVANILARPLIELAPSLAAVQQPGGRIALAGVLEDQAPGVLEAYAGDYRIDCAGERGGWVLLAGTRR